ncbi:unnamed protein product [Phytophthora lilii]|uniref:Unnamed protein product n=1 Tax=Phytophthora lilii TaxID=2077276 RepID=A0A9W6YK88_9STRA|nr:unnamed protein product [Phytophthora lilii]
MPLCITCRAALALVLVVAVVDGEVSFPGVEFNAAVGEPAHASSYYNYAPNVLHDTVFVPGNANDGFPDETSWWSAGDNASEQVFWQVNMSSLAPSLSRIVVRWHGFLSPRSYKIRVSYDGVDFTSIIAVFNLSSAYDRVDNHTQGLSKLSTRFKYVRLVISEPNVCSDQYSCVDDGTSSTSTSETNERVIYGIRELEVWAKGTRNGTLESFEDSQKFVRGCVMMEIGCVMCRGFEDFRDGHQLRRDRSSADGSAADRTQRSLMNMTTSSHMMKRLNDGAFYLNKLETHSLLTRDTRASPRRGGQMV